MGVVIAGSAWSLAMPAAELRPCQWTYQSRLQEVHNPPGKPKPVSMPGTRKEANASPVMVPGPLQSPQHSGNPTALRLSDECFPSLSCCGML